MGNNKAPPISERCLFFYFFCFKIHSRRTASNCICIILSPTSSLLSPCIQNVKRLKPL